MANRALDFTTFRGHVGVDFFRDLSPGTNSDAAGRAADPQGRAGYRLDFQVGPVFPVANQFRGSILAP